VKVPLVTQFVNAETLTVELDLPSWLRDTYDLRVTKGNVVQTLGNALNVTDGGQSNFQTNLIVPSAVGFNIPIKQTIWIEYKNTGDLAMPAPLLELTGDHGARLTTDATIQPRAGSGEIAGTSDIIQILGSGKSATPWLLQPGESVRVPVYYLGLSESAHYPQVTFSLDAYVIPVSNEAQAPREQGNTDDRIIKLDDKPFSWQESWYDGVIEFSVIPTYPSFIGSASSWFKSALTQDFPSPWEFDYGSVGGQPAQANSDYHVYRSTLYGGATLHYSAGS